MGTQRTRRTATFRAGLGIVTVGAILGVFGITANPASADKPDTFKITICHRTNAPTNPYRVIEVSVDAGNGELVGPDHTGHPGPVFDFTADPQAEDYPYTTPRDGDQWGDIIPGYDFGDGQHYDGMNWDEAGQAIWGEQCQGPNEPDDPTCPVEGQVWDDADDNGEIGEGECSTPPVFECPADTTGADANDNGLVDEGECVEANVFGCPAGTTGSDANDNGEVDEGECTAPEVPQVDPKDPIDVLGEVITAEQPATLPRTGSTTLPMAEAGLGLVLLGLGAMLMGKPETASI